MCPPAGVAWSGTGAQKGEKKELTATVMKAEVTPCTLHFFV